MLKRFLRTGLLGLALAAGPLSADPGKEAVVTYPASGTFEEVVENVKCLRYPPPYFVDQSSY